MSISIRGLEDADGCVYEVRIDSASNATQLAALAIVTGDDVVTATASAALLSDHSTRPWEIVGGALVSHTTLHDVHTADELRSAVSGLLAQCTACENAEAATSLDYTDDIAAFVAQISALLA